MIKFKDLKLAPKLLTALDELGYEHPTPIQEQSIPILLNGRDLLATAQTGTGKTAAFALPILTQLDLKLTKPQALILAPTRELAIQVAEAFQSYAKHLRGFHVLPIYGGQDYRPQLRALDRGVHVIVGTPGRVMDHMRRGTLKVDKVKTMILDEADRMLDMGFVDDMKWILEQLPKPHRTALFSATMPNSIQRIAGHYLHKPEKVTIKSKTATVAAIEQSYILISRHHKLEALTRFLEIETFEGVIIFVRTKTMSDELAEKLEARGYAVSAMNGDMNQKVRETVIRKLKNKNLDIIVATDVAARGLDVDRISHVINYDIPYDTESYIHRIGRTGRAGRLGKAILFISPNERRMLRDIERATRQAITAVEAPSVKQINKKRAQHFSGKIIEVLNNADLDYSRHIVTQIAKESDASELDIAAALVHLANKKNPLELKGENTLRVRKSDHGKSNKKKKFNKKKFEGKSGKPKRRSEKKKSKKPSKAKRSQ